MDGLLLCREFSRLQFIQSYMFQDQQCCYFLNSSSVEDRADVGSWWSGYPDIYGKPDMKRPRRVDETIGNQAGFMATRSQIEYFHNEACPGGFLPHVSHLSIIYMFISITSHFILFQFD